MSKSIEIDLPSFYPSTAKLSEIPNYIEKGKFLAGKGNDVILTGQAPIWLYILRFLLSTAAVKCMKENQEISTLKETLIDLRKEGKVLVAILYGSYASCTQHVRSDIDLALYLKPSGSHDELDIVDRILMAVDRDISILRLDDEDESPFVTWEALKGIHLVEPDRETLYAVSHRILHECEENRFRREIKSWTG